MKYFVIKVRTYESLSTDYSVSNVLNNKEDAVTLAGIFTRMADDPHVCYIVAGLCDEFCQPAAIPADYALPE